MVEILTFNQVSEQQAIGWAAALEQGSNHPLARAIMERAAGQTLPQVAQFRTLRGAGVSGEIDGVPVLLATPRCWSSIRLRPPNWKRRCAPRPNAA